jgi:tRNA (guanine37-N1)-methyltransferase
MSVCMLFAKVPKKDAQKVHAFLIEKKAFARGYATVQEGGFVYFPIAKKMRGDFENVEMEAEPLPKKYLRMEDALAKTLTKKEMGSLVTSFDIIGDIAIIDIPESLEKKEGEIANAVLAVHKNVKVVAKKTGAMSGEFRVRPLKVIAGENRTETIYREHGVRMRLDVASVYFSVRLSAERKRIAGLVMPGETILALFAGVGPFPLVISRTHPDARIVAVELNPEAVRYMEGNIKLNKSRNIEAVLGDARDVVFKNYRNFADRVLMPLPKSADSFLDAAIAGVKDGGTVHFYAFAPEEDPYSDAEKKIREEAKKAGASVSFLNERIVRPYAPRVVQVAIDFRVIRS